MNEMLLFSHQVRFVLVGLLLITLLVGGGCTSANNASGPGQAQTKFLDAAGMQKEYQAAAAKLKLPPGMVFRENANTGGAQSFEEGVGLSNAQNYWMAAWEIEWLEQRNKDEARARKALDVLKNEVPKSELMTKGCDEATRRFYAEYLKKAELGDPSGFQQDIAVTHFTPLRSRR